ncbi:MAG: class I SAM-dependent methyltransferase [Cytophagales bacterium]|nr:MAG: class I SAM-dependent methyltransferase [Cytophagales bacterium]
MGAWLWWQYWLRAKNEYHIHSPFLYDLYTKVIKKSQSYSKEKHIEIEHYRKVLAKERRFITIQDYGAGSKIFKTPQRSIAQIIRYTVSPPAFGQLMYRLVAYFNPYYVVELGTNLGFTTAYLAKALKEGELFSLEGCAATQAEARKNLEHWQLDRVHLLLGNIDDTFPKLIEELPQIDFLLIDANHSYEATWRYFEWSLSKIHENSVLVIADIYWSEGMQRAWAEISKHVEVSLSVDLYEVGILFFRKKQAKQHFILHW